MEAKRQPPLFNEDGDPATVMRSIAQEANDQYFMTTSTETLTRRRYIANGVFAVVAAVGLLLLWRFLAKWRERRREQAELRSELLTGAVTPGRAAPNTRTNSSGWLAPRGGIEPPTRCLEGSRSIP